MVRLPRAAGAAIRSGRDQLGSGFSVRIGADPLYESPRIRTGPAGNRPRARCGGDASRRRFHGRFRVGLLVRSRLGVPGCPRRRGVGQPPRSPAGWNTRGQSRCCRDGSFLRHRASGPAAPGRREGRDFGADPAAFRPCGRMARAGCSTWNWRRISRAAIGIYFSYAGARCRRKRRHRRGEGDARGDTLRDVRVIYRQQPKLVGPNHFGSRIAFDRQRPRLHQPGRALRYRIYAQHLDKLQGKLVRLNLDGSIPGRQPVCRPQGRASRDLELRPSQHAGARGGSATGTLWESEHGPRGGDEINLPRGGRNYGWPIAATAWTTAPARRIRKRAAPMCAGTERRSKYWKKSPGLAGMAFFAAIRNRPGTTACSSAPSPIAT